MDSQEEWYGYWAINLMEDAPDTNAIWELNQTMIYTDLQAKALAGAAIEKAEETAKAGDKEPISEAEKERLWKAVMESCSG